MTLMDTLMLPIVAVTCANAPIPAWPSEPLRDVRTIVCLGDRITQMGEAQGGYVWLLRKYLAAVDRRIRVINVGISGHRSNDMLERFDRDVVARKPDMVTISVGVNDVWHGFTDDHPLGDGPRGIPLKDYRRNVEMMVEKAKTAGIRVVILSTTVIHEDLNNRENAKLVGYNSALRDIARREGALFIDLQSPFRALIRRYRSTTGARDNLLTIDGVHMNPAGNKVIANTILDGLKVPSETRQSLKL